MVRTIVYLLQQVCPACVSFFFNISLNKDIIPDAAKPHIDDIDRLCNAGATVAADHAHSLPSAEYFRRIKHIHFINDSGGKG